MSKVSREYSPFCFSCSFIRALFHLLFRTKKAKFHHFFLVSSRLHYFHFFLLFSVSFALHSNAITLHCLIVVVIINGKKAIIEMIDGRTKVSRKFKSITSTRSTWYSSWCSQTTKWTSERVRASFFNGFSTLSVWTILLTRMKACSIGTKMITACGKWWKEWVEGRKREKNMKKMRAPFQSSVQQQNIFFFLFLFSFLLFQCLKKSPICWHELFPLVLLHFGWKVKMLPRTHSSTTLSTRPK